MENNTELKLCPFCGGQAKLKATTKRSTGFTIWCECGKCHAETAGYCPDINKEDSSIDNIEQCKKYAMEKWNKRIESK